MRKKLKYKIIESFFSLKSNGKFYFGSEICDVLTNFRENILKNTEKPLKNNKKWRNCAAYNRALAKCGAENPN